MLEKVDLYATRQKAATKVGGIFSVVALCVAVAYGAWLVHGFVTQPPSVDSSVQWADTNGPWPMEIRCVAASGCWVSNAHSKWSSNGDKVAAAQQSCFYLTQGQEYTINFTFTQDPHAGLIMAWNASSNSSSTPGAGVTVRADTNCPSCPGGVFSLWTPALGGTYLANLIETTNGTSSEAPFRREWFLTYVSEGSGLQPWAPCWGTIAAADRGSTTQASIRIMSAWYSVTISKPAQWLQLLGNAGGGASASMTIGGLLVAVIQLLVTWYTWRVHKSKRASAVQPESGGNGHNTPRHTAQAPAVQQGWVGDDTEDSEATTPNGHAPKGGKKGKHSTRAIPQIAAEAW